MVSIGQSALKNGIFRVTITREEIRMKKTLRLLGILFMMFVFMVGCGKEETPEPSADENNAVTGFAGILTIE